MKTARFVLIALIIAFSGCSLFTKKNDITGGKTTEEMIQESHEQARKQDSLRLIKLKQASDSVNKSLKDLNQFMDSLKNKNK